VLPSVMHSGGCSPTLKFAEKQRMERWQLKKAQELRPDLIVLDRSKPVMNGFDAARVLKRLMPTVPLIMFSAFGDGSVRY
jgi:CheY-like chemotaxis protein